MKAIAAVSLTAVPSITTSWAWPADWHASHRDYPRQGIDVSHHQKPIERSALSAGSRG